MPSPRPRRRARPRISTASTSRRRTSSSRDPRPRSSPGSPTAAPHAGVPCFGPPLALAPLEASKGYARELATSLGIPGPPFARFGGGDVDAAIALVAPSSGSRSSSSSTGWPAARASSCPTDDAETEAAIRARRAPFVLEERMIGPECSLLALCDGRDGRRAAVRPGPQAHRRGRHRPEHRRDGRLCPGPGAVRRRRRSSATFVQPVLDHFAAAGTPYVGVLYAGLMLTADGPRLVEYNVRFGDPEAQAVLPLLRSDFAALALACTQGDIRPCRSTSHAGRGVPRRRRRSRLPGTPAGSATPGLPTRRGRRSDARASSNAARCSRPGWPAVERPAGGCWR